MDRRFKAVAAGLVTNAVLACSAMVSAAGERDIWSEHLPEGSGSGSLTMFKKPPAVDGVIEKGEWGPLFEQALPSLKMRIVNPGPARVARVKLHAFTTDMPGIDKTETLDLPAGGEASYEFTIEPHRFHEEAQHCLRVTVTDAASENAWLDYGFLWHKPRDAGNAWQVVTGPKPEEALKIAYYPSHDLLRVQVDPRELAEEDQGSTKADIALTSERGETLLHKTITWESLPAEQQFEIPNLAEGLYTVAAKFDGCGETIENTFRRQFFPWEGSRMGVTDEVLPPFMPITVEGRQVNVVLRRYKMTGLGLWSSVEAKGQDEGEDYKELLAAPMELVADGNRVLQGTGRFTSTEPHQAVYEGKAEHPAVRLSVKSIIEVDGCMRVELTLQPAAEPREIRSLSLGIPLRDTMAPLYHVCSTTLRTNPAGGTPAGEGLVWTSDDYPEGTWYDNFHPYVWFGGVARGLCWFADNDKGWVLDGDEEEPKDVPCQELIRIVTVE